MRFRARVARLESARSERIATHFQDACICFPVAEQPEFRWQAEVDHAAKVRCPIHGVRFQTVVTRHLYQASRFYISDFERGWPHLSAQYQKAMRASLDPSLWPAQEEEVPWPNEVRILVLRDGSRIPSGGRAEVVFRANRTCPYAKRLNAWSSQIPSGHFSAANAVLLRKESS